MDKNCHLCSDKIAPGETAYEEQTHWILQNEPVAFPNGEGGHDLIPVTTSVMLPTGRAAHQSCVDAVKAGLVEGQEPLFG